VIVVNPLRELRARVASASLQPVEHARSSRVTDLYLQPHIGERHRALQSPSEGSDRARRVEPHLRGRPHGRLGGARGGHPRRRLGRAYLGGRAGSPAPRSTGPWRSCWRRGRDLPLGDGPHAHAHGVDNILALSRTSRSAAAGWGGPDGLLPIRGHSNIQGVGLVGGMTPFLKRSFARKCPPCTGSPNPEGPARHLRFDARRRARGGVRAGPFCSREPLCQQPDRDWAARRCGRSADRIQFTNTLNEGHVTAVPDGGDSPDPRARRGAAGHGPRSPCSISCGCPRRRYPGRCGGDAPRKSMSSPPWPSRSCLRAGFDWSTLRYPPRLRQEMARVVPRIRGDR